MMPPSSCGRLEIWLYIVIAAPGAGWVELSDPRGIAMTTNSTSAPRTSSSSTPSLLRDQLAQFNGPAKVSAGEKGGRSTLGWMLTLCGIAMSGWVLLAIHAAIFHPERLGLPLRIIRAEDLAMLIPSGKVQLPAAAITLVGY